MIITILSNVSSSIPQEQKVLKVKVTQWCPILCNPMDYSLWNSLGQNTGVGSLSLLQAIFPTQGSNPGLPHCEWIFYQLSYKGSPRILEWVAYPFFRGSSQPRNWTRVSCIAGGFFTNWATSEAQESWSVQTISSLADLPDPGIKLGSPALQADSLLTELSGNQINNRGLFAYLHPNYCAE